MHLTNGSTMKSKSLVIGAAVGLLMSRGVARAQTPDDKELAKQIFETMIKVPGVQKGYRPVHSKGTVCHGKFEPTSAAAGLSKAAHFQATVPVTIRFSVGAVDPTTPDNTDGGPRGMAIRFELPGGEETDIVAISQNGFVVSTGAEFLELQQSIVATDPSKPHPWPVEQFVGSHPSAMRFVTGNAIIPVSLATEAFFGNDAFVFVNKNGAKQAGRYQIIPLAGRHDLTADEAKSQGQNFLMDDLKARVAKEPVKYRVLVQLPNAGDRTDDPSIVWPEDHKTIEVGKISVKSIDADSASAEKMLAFDPINLTDGIEQSDDPFPALRSKVYAMSVRYRQKNQK
jgi:catalase